MTAAELLAFGAKVRAEATAAIARLDTIDPDALPGLLRAEYDLVRGNWIKLLAMTADDVVELHVAACLAAGRELTEEEMHGLLSRQ